MFTSFFYLYGRFFVPKKNFNTYYVNVVLNSRFSGHPVVIKIRKKNSLFMTKKVKNMFKTHKFKFDQIYLSSIENFKTCIPQTFGNILEVRIPKQRVVFSGLEILRLLTFSLLGMGFFSTIRISYKKQDFSAHGRHLLTIRGSCFRKKN